MKQRKREGRAYPFTPKTRKVAIGQLIMHGREQHLVGIKPLGRRSIPIAETLDVFLLGAMDATEEWCRCARPHAR